MEKALERGKEGRLRATQASMLPSEPGRRKALFLSLVHTNEPTLIRVARRLCRSRDDADDVVQEAIVSAYKAFMAGRFQDLPNFRPWMLTIVRNTFLRGERTRRRWVLTDGETLAALRESKREPPATTDREYDLEQALMALNDEQRLCVELVYFEQLEYAEIAAMLQIPIGTVRSRLARARYSMYESLTESERARSEP
ncbi:MAG: RNA polymerase sigma factor [Fimbriimonadaceae bacterium]|nr:RNA polymerase sigma factor [Chthonomonadaceae bacterium]MCO5295649.1 RNA polymerase sigma factor [Fimbriimonadaceae bacterium]